MTGGRLVNSGMRAGTRTSGAGVALGWGRVQQQRLPRRTLRLRATVPNEEERMRRREEEFRRRREIVEGDPVEMRPCDAVRGGCIPPDGEGSLAAAARLEKQFARDYKKELEIAADSELQEIVEERRAAQVEKQEELKTKIREAVQEAEETCETEASSKCAAAWDEAEELQAELSRQKMKEEE